MLAEFWAGYVSGAAGIIIGNPLDIVKVRAQASLHSASAISDSSLGVRQGLISSRPEKLSTFTSLLRGLPAPVLTYGALNALLFVSYSQALLFSSYIYPGVGRGSTTGSNTGSSHPYWNHFTAGCFAGIATFIVSAPTELIKCRAQTTREHTARGKPISSWAIARSTYVQDGIRGLYHGGTVTVLRDSVGYGFYFLSYEACKDLWDHAASSLGTQGTSSPTTLLAMDSTKVLLCGGIAGVISWTSIFPLDVIKTRVQAQPSHSPTAGAWAIAKQAYATEGSHVFVRGLGVCCARAFIVNAVQWFVYEAMIRQSNPEADNNTPLT